MNVVDVELTYRQDNIFVLCVCRGKLTVQKHVDARVSSILEAICTCTVYR
jgi:hypothetical protein